ncbi:Alpha/Beta hydrolase protein [Daedaleopsis nitida]|nr:Alpha/Beta hydrolase protein [Daedaleopsis nitida]
MNVATDPATSASSTTSPSIDPLYFGSEELLSLPDGRTLAYSHSGPADSSLVVLWYHGLFSVGDASSPQKPFRDRKVHFIAPTLPGWGSTSPLPAGATFPETVVSDTNALFAHLYPGSDPASGSPMPPLRIYVAGGSFGTCPAQIICGAPYDRFPQGRQIVALLLAAPMSPFREDAGYGRALTWRDWLGVGAPTRVVPANLIARAMKVALQARVREVARAEGLLRRMLFDKMGEGERARFAAWRARNGVREGEFERRMAEGMVKSVGRLWAGFVGTADALHADWGFTIKGLDEEHRRKRVLVVVGRGDTSMFKMSRYLLDNYENTKLVEYEGGHLAAAWSLDQIWEETFAEFEDVRT